MADENEQIENETAETPEEPVAEEKPKRRSRKKAEEAAAETVEAPVVAEEVEAAEAPVDEPVAAEEPETVVAEEPIAAPEEGGAPADLPLDAPVAEAEPEPVAAEELPVEEATEEAPVADAEPAADVEATQAEAEAPAPAPQSGPKPKRKRVRRSERRQRSKPKRERPAGERAAITRLPKPEHARGRSQERRGVVVSAAMDKTIVVKVDTVKAHPRYKKVVRRSTKFHAHDEQNSAKVGDVVRIVETRPLSKTKYWRLAEVVEVAK